MTVEKEYPMRITALIAASVAALALAAVTSPASAASSPVQEPSAVADNTYVESASTNLRQDNDRRGRIDQDIIGADISASMHLVSTHDAQAAAGNHGHILVN